MSEELKVNKRDKEQLEYWATIYQYMSATYQMQEDALQIDKDREEFYRIKKEREDWLLDNWQLIRPSIATRNRRKPINVFNVNK